MGLGFMKGRPSIAVLFAILALLFASVPGQAKTATRKQAKRAHPQQAKSVKPVQSYSVHAGDTLYGIARDFRTTPDALKSANKLKGNTIKPGQILSIPGFKVAAAQAKQRSVAEATHSQIDSFISAAPVESIDKDKTENPETSSTQLRLVQAGFDMLGVRYRFGGSGNGSFDCSGLVKSLFSKFNIDLPRSSKEQFKQGQKVSKDELQVGDLVFFSSGGSQPTHVGIYVGDNKFLHAARKAKKVVVSDLSKIWYTMRYVGARRVMDLWSDEPVTE
jgi:peptidoglycan DL-endopeptidase LytE